MKRRHRSATTCTFRYIDARAATPSRGGYDSYDESEKQEKEKEEEKGEKN